VRRPAPRHRIRVIEQPEVRHQPVQRPVGRVRIEGGSCVFGYFGAGCGQVWVRTPSGSSDATSRRSRAPAERLPVGVPSDGRDRSGHVWVRTLLDELQRHLLGFRGFPAQPPELLPHCLLVHSQPSRHVPGRNAVPLQTQDFLRLRRRNARSPSRVSGTPAQRSQPTFRVPSLGTPDRARRVAERPGHRHLIREPRRHQADHRVRLLYPVAHAMREARFPADADHAVLAVRHQRAPAVDHLGPVSYPFWREQIGLVLVRFHARIFPHPAEKPDTFGSAPCRDR